MRKISNSFLDCLKAGFLSEITEFVKADHDLNLEIRDGYINIYFKGNSLLKLTGTRSPDQYRAKVHKKFLVGLEAPVVFTESTTPEFVD